MHQHVPGILWENGITAHGVSAHYCICRKNTKTQRLCRCCCLLLQTPGPSGWYAVWNTTDSLSYTAPKRLELIVFNIPRTKAVLWASCWPNGRC